MKIYLTCGLGMALANAAYTFAVYFLGYHDTIEQMQNVGLSILNMVVIIAICALGVRSAMATVRSQAVERGLSYGRGVGVSALTGLFYGGFSAVFQVLYFTVINPKALDVLLEAQHAAAEARGGGVDLEKIEAVVRVVVPVMMFVMTFIFAVGFAVVMGLIMAAFMKRAPTAEPPPVPAA